MADVLDSYRHHKGCHQYEEYEPPSAEAAQRWQLRELEWRATDDSDLGEAAYYMLCALKDLEEGMERGLDDVAEVAEGAYSDVRTRDLVLPGSADWLP